MKLFQSIGGNALIKKWRCLDAKVIININKIISDFGPCFGVFFLYFFLFLFY